jgi:TRAP-type mannitol/chloroaromatic compound transport system substrate-binding protein
MKRRQFIQAATVGVAAAAIAKPAVAQSSPAVKWRLTASWPKSLDTLWGSCVTISKYVAEATDGKFQIEIFAGGEIVPPLQALDAVTNGTVEACHTATYYYVGKDPTFALFCAVPFGLNARQQNAWFYDANGSKLMDEFTAKYNCVSLVAGNTGCQMGGWFRSEIRTVADLKGLKFRIGGFAGQVLTKLGVVPQQIGGGDIYKIAKYYYYPGWWEGGTANHLMINSGKWNELPKSYQAIVRAAAGFANVEQQGRYDARNPAALRRLLAGGTQLRPFTPAIMEASYKAANEVYAETSAKNAPFKKTWDDIVAFRSEEYFWWQVAEYTYDTFMIRSRTAG